MYSLLQVTYDPKCSHVLRSCRPVYGVDDPLCATEMFNQLVSVECADGEKPVFTEFSETENGIAPEKEAVIMHDSGEVVLVALFNA